MDSYFVYIYVHIIIIHMNNICMYICMHIHVQYTCVHTNIMYAQYKIGSELFYSIKLTSSALSRFWSWHEASPDSEMAVQSKVELESYVYKLESSKNRTCVVRTYILYYIGIKASCRIHLLNRRKYVSNVGRCIYTTIKT